jgi:hypothetical protein
LRCARGGQLVEALHDRLLDYEQRIAPENDDGPPEHDEELPGEEDEDLAEGEEEDFPEDEEDEVPEASGSRRARRC